ncbi:hypothetical protein L596_000224 [Steinernema carpocapsae]|uniref:Uncharacterized protein n=1 Tax=Steinernema carpocapsae TaxID=34508 RepID=A0A4U8UI37_STECR|nr:hypothetical protein L596_000224 [Steinernema carpocapsae]
MWKRFERPLGKCGTINNKAVWSRTVQVWFEQTCLVCTKDALFKRFREKLSSIDCTQKRSNWTDQRRDTSLQKSTKFP